ncbi:MAG: fimbrillin family protein [Bacteroidaceae bacterium]|nr:fimbrillin family protein [Bacteroidaceae bacterium]
MLKKIFYILTLGVFATGCSKMNEAEEVKQLLESQPVPVLFGTYVSQNADTRSTVVTDKELQGTAGSINSLEKLQAVGFSVFGHYTDNTTYTANASGPNFMYNQKVEWNATSGAWEYRPIKYWPNEGTDYLSFFAYAPRIDNPAGTGTNNEINPEDKSATHWGIVNLTDNHTDEDPWVDYKPAQITKESVDLLWAVDNTTGKPHIDLSKPGVNEKVELRFKHALAGFKVTVKVDADLWDELTDGDKTDLRNSTLISIDKMEIKGSFPNAARLNLNNYTANVPAWDYTNSAKYDDETEKISTFVIDDQSIVEYLRTPENIWKNKDNFSEGLDETFEAHLNGTHRMLGATGEENLFMKDGTEETMLMVIPPQNDTDLEVKLTYSVTAVNPRLELTGGYHRITQTVSKTLDNISIEAGNIYVINCAIGLNGVRLKIVNVYEWSEPIVFGAPDVDPWRPEDRGSLDFEVE